LQEAIAVLRLILTGRLRRQTIAFAGAITALLFLPRQVIAQTADLTNQTQSIADLKATSNLVVVRVVVRDAQGKPVKGLKKEYFQIFDRGKEQAIAQFEEEAPSSEALPPIKTSSPSTIAAPRHPLPAKRFLVLYFDDVDMSDSDAIDARDAADHYLATNLQPDERVALFTSSGMLSDFTADIDQLQKGLSKLHAHPRVSKQGDCPSISDYQAAEISEQDNPNNSDAWKIALDEAVNRCHLPTISEVTPPGAKPVGPPAPSNAAPQTVAMVQNLARSILAQSEIQARTNLQRLEQMVDIVSRAPGARSIILVSPGFQSHSEQYQLDQIIDQALHSQVIISSLDPRGLALLMREADVTNGYMPSANSGVVGSQHEIDTDREMVAGDVLAEVADGTGGAFFRNNNDLVSGFRALGTSAGSYILAFSPKNVKEDGKYHALKVKLVESRAGLILRARRGYFAVKEGKAPDEPPHLEVRPLTSPTIDAETQQKEKIKEAVLSKTEVQQLPVELRMEVSKDGKNGELAVLAHLDAKGLRFRHEGSRNQSTVTFISVVFDESGKYLTGQQRQAVVDLADSDLPRLLASGMDVKTTFQLDPGTYTIREVIADSEEHNITALLKKVRIP
jgi:VWFA-related protein